jgi:hypothetical protein
VRPAIGDKRDRAHDRIHQSAAAGARHRTGDDPITPVMAPGERFATRAVAGSATTVAWSTLHGLAARPHLSVGAAGRVRRKIARA